MDLPELIHLGEFASGVEDVLAGVCAAFHPSPAAEADADVGAVGDLEGLHVTVERAEHVTRHAAEFRHRRVIGVDADPSAGLFGDGNDLLDEIFPVVPELFFRELATVREGPFEYFADPVAFGG